MGTLIAILVVLFYIVGFAESVVYLCDFYKRHQVKCPRIVLIYGGIFWFIWLPQAIAFDFRMKHLEKKK